MTTRTSTRPSNKIIAAATAGTVVEWYDFFIYGTAATLVFGQVFFPGSSELVGIIAAFGTYAVGFVARPIGGVVFGHFGDKVGRKKLLQISLMIIGVSTFLIGVLPTHAQVGTLAPALLVLLRFLQGFALGGEWGGAVLLVSEHGDAARRGLWASFPQASVPAGNILATAVLAVLSLTLTDAQFLSWGWRVAFLLSALLIAIGYYVRTQVEDAPVFKEAMARAAEQDVDHSPLKEVLGGYSGTVGKAMGIRLVENIHYYMVVSFTITYLKVQVGVDTASILNLMLIAHAVHLVAVPYAGSLSDRLGRKPVTGVGIVLSAIFGVVAFTVFDTGNVAAILGVVIFGLVAHALMYGPQAAFLSEMFPTRMRYTGISVACQVTAILGGALAPIIATALLDKYGSSTPITVYLLSAAAVSLVSLAVTRETRGVDYADLDAVTHAARRPVTA